MNIKKIVVSSALYVVIGMLLVLLSIGVQFAPNLVQTGSVAGAVMQGAQVFSLLTYVFFMLIIMSASSNAVKKYGSDVSEAAWIAVVSYAGPALFHLLINGIAVFWFLSQKNIQPYKFSSIESKIAATLFGDLEGVRGEALSLGCGFLLLFMGCSVNYVIGAMAAKRAGDRKETKPMLKH